MNGRASHKIDLAKRRRVMERSQRIGHCICDVRRPCPCDVFRNDGICPCAGERPDPPADLSGIRLTQLVRNAGCASKISPCDLEAVLGRLPSVNDPAVISGLAAADDAAIYRISDNLCLVQTVDVFAPCVDDPHLFGRICAANCLSDIYAMGGEPRTALSVLAFPAEKLPGEIMYQMLAGAMEVFQGAGVALVGGHSIKDDEIKLGFAITGLIDPAVAAALEMPRAGDVLVLTKPLGSGVLAFCQQVGRGHLDGMAAAAKAMATLNKNAAEAMKEAGASACTDVTGFGLFAHLFRLLRPSKLSAEIFAENLPAFDGAIEALREGFIPGAIERNREYVGDALHICPGVDESRVNLGLDAQTSGGLLIAAPVSRLEQLQQSLKSRGVTGFVIGRIVAGAEQSITVMSAEPNKTAVFQQYQPVNPSPINLMNAPSSESSSHAAGCCAGMSPKEAASGSVSESQRAFGALMRSVQAAGVLDKKAKELILFSLVVQSRCAPCLETHFRLARELGITQSELDEAAWCAIAMGGAPVKMFYQESLERIRQNG